MQTINKDIDLVPNGYKPIVHSAPYGAVIGPIYERTDEEDSVRAFRVKKQHTNSLGYLHGGMLMSFADIVLAQAVIGAGRGLTATVRMVTEFMAPGRLGDWVEGRASISKSSGTLLFTEGQFQVGANLIMIASGIFVVPSDRKIDSE